MGPIEAKNFGSEILFNAISEPQEEQKSISEEEIEKKLSKKVQDYQQAAKTHVA
jgi:hypothetical protein